MSDKADRIPDARGERHPEGSAFTGVLKMRDHVIHQYDGVDPEIVWEAVQHHIPELRRQVDEEVKKLG